MDINKIKDFINTRKQLLIIVPVILLLLIGVVYIGNRKKTSDSSDSGTLQEALLEPTSESENVPQNKREAYEAAKLNESRKRRIEESPLVRGSDFYFSMAEKDEKYKQQLKEDMERMKVDPYNNLMSEYETEDNTGNGTMSFSNRMKAQLDQIEDEETFNRIVQDAKMNERLRNQIKKEDAERQERYKDIIGLLPEKNQPKKRSVEKTVEEANEDTKENVEESSESESIVIENGKRRRRQKVIIPTHTNLIKACIHGDQVLVSGSIVRMRLLEPLTTGGLHIPVNTIFSGEASLGANRLSIVVKNLKKGAYMSPVSFVIYDNDAIEGLNLPNNMKAEAARQMERGLVNGVQLPISSIGTVSSEIASAISTTTQVAKQILNMRLSQVKVHVKANYQMYIQEETVEAKRKREAVEAELDNLYKKLEEQQSDPTTGNPLSKLIDKL